MSYYPTTANKLSTLSDLYVVTLFLLIQGMDLIKSINIAWLKFTACFFPLIFFPECSIRQICIGVWLL